MGCPYGSEVPIDKPSIKIDEKLIGKWENRSSSDEVYVVKKEDDYTYRFEEKSSDGSEPTIYYAYLSDVDGTRFLNVWQKDAQPLNYYFYKLEISGTGVKVTLHPVNENIDETFYSSAELKDFIRKNMKLSFFYEKDQDEYIKTD